MHRFKKENVCFSMQELLVFEKMVNGKQDTQGYESPD
jgi:hypothetical protein